MKRIILFVASIFLLTACAGKKVEINAVQQPVKVEQNTTITPELNNTKVVEVEAPKVSSEVNNTSIQTSKVISETKEIKLHKSMYSVNEAASGSINLQDTVAKIAQDLVGGFKKDVIGNKNIAITSFVDLHQINKSSHFGRAIGESFYNELFKKDVNIIDFRMSSALVVNADGEYFLSRDVKKLNKKVDVDYVLVGTYASVEEGVLINARIINASTGKIVASSRGVYTNKNCEIFENCKPTPPKVIYFEKSLPAKQHSAVNITTDNCSKEKYPNNCTAGNCQD